MPLRKERRREHGAERVKPVNESPHRAQVAKNRAARNATKKPVKKAAKKTSKKES